MCVCARRPGLQLVLLAPVVEVERGERKAHKVGCVCIIKAEGGA
jgi:hypothetical protein